MRVLWLSLLVVVVDQATKAAVLQFMAPQNGVHQTISILGDWLRFTFTENPGMAFGLNIGPPGTVTILSLIATGLVAAYIYHVRHGYAPFRWSLALILGGAVGNIIDRVFYGVIMEYGTFFTGHVVDFIHVSLWKGFIPSSIPLVGGAYLELFPIWNVADMSIVVGVVGVLLFHQTYHEQARAAQDEAAEGSDVNGLMESVWPSSTTADGVPAEPVSASEQSASDENDKASPEGASSWRLDG